MERERSIMDSDYIFCALELNYIIIIFLLFFLPFQSSKRFKEDMYIFYKSGALLHNKYFNNKFSTHLNLDQAVFVSKNKSIDYRYRCVIFLPLFLLCFVLFSFSFFFSQIVEHFSFRNFFFYRMLKG